jgi:dihydroorotase-like cyclic amidohydrolase
MTPYAGEKLSGVVAMTFLRGEKVFDHGEFAKEPKGVQCFRA